MYCPVSPLAKAMSFPRSSLKTLYSSRTLEASSRVFAKGAVFTMSAPAFLHLRTIFFISSREETVSWWELTTRLVRFPFSAILFLTAFIKDSGDRMSTSTYRTPLSIAARVCSKAIFLVSSLNLKVKMHSGWASIKLSVSLVVKRHKSARSSANGN